MKAKYLVQLQTNNANMGATGWFTIDSSITKRAADEKASNFRHARPVDDLRAVRVISTAKFTDEVISYNRAAFRAAHA